MSRQDTIFYEKAERIFMNNSSTMVMGILNVTEDSFFDGGRYLKEEQWLAQAQLMVDAGADIIDVGACSSRPGAIEISEDEELAKLVPALSSLRKHFPEVLLSADTYRAAVAVKAVAAGANLINDISGGSLDPLLWETVARLKVPYVLMHMQGTPSTMQQNPEYEDVVQEVHAYFEKSLKKLEALGIKQVILDPGFGFGKSLEHNYLLLKNMEAFQSLGKPLLVGFSRKSMVAKLLNVSTKDSLNGTSTLNAIALQKGAKFLRVHDVKEAKEVVKITEFMSSL